MEEFCLENIYWKVRSLNAKIKSMKNLKILLSTAGVIIFIGLIGFFVFLNKKDNSGLNTPMKKMNNPTVVLKTNKGDIEIELFMDKMPITAGNFLKLSKEGFYNGTKFHRVINGFMIQGGDPNSRGEDTSLYGTGGPGYVIADEFVAGLSNARGTIAMANSGPNSGGSQFFINLVDNTGLDFDKPPFTSKHPVFGKVITGMGVVDMIAKEDIGYKDIPVNPIIIEEVLVNE